MEDIKNLKEIVDLCEKEIKNNDDNTTAILDIADLKSLKNILNELDRLKKENEELSYIISEIEQYALDEQINEESIDYNEFIEVQNMAFDIVYNKLQELLNKGK